MNCLAPSWRQYFLRALHALLDALCARGYYLNPPAKLLICLPRAAYHGSGCLKQLVGIVGLQTQQYTCRRWFH